MIEGLPTIQSLITSPVRVLSYLPARLDDNATEHNPCTSFSERVRSSLIPDLARLHPAPENLSVSPQPLRRRGQRPIKDDRHMYSSFISPTTLSLFSCCFTDKSSCDDEHGYTTSTSGRVAWGMDGGYFSSVGYFQLNHTYNSSS